MNDGQGVGVEDWDGVDEIRSLGVDTEIADEVVESGVAVTNGMGRFSIAPPRLVALRLLASFGMLQDTSHSP